MSAIVPPTPMDRTMDSFRRIVREMLAPTRFYGTYEYTIEAATSATCTGTPTDASQGLPPMVTWPMRGGVCGENATPTPGSLCEVIFVNGDRTRPEVVRVVGPPLMASIDATVSLTLGASAAATKIGAAPAPLAKAAPLETALTALGTFFTALAAACTNPPTSTTFTLFAAAAAPLATTAAAAMVAAGVALPTTTTEAT